MRAIEDSRIPKAQPQTEAGRLYVNLVDRLLWERRRDAWGQEQEADVCDQLDMLWNLMDESEQHRAKQAVPHPSDLLF